MEELIRQRTQRLEAELLSPRAALSGKTRGRLRPEKECDIRTPFQRDRDRILHSKSFRRLKHKTQVFLAPEGDHYRTRLTHTLEVAQIARTIARSLLLNEDLTEAIALGHDLGHTPFGHAGERALNSICENGFHHYEQSVRVTDVLEKDGAGLNLTQEVRNGILCHTSGEQAFTLEGRIVRLSDKIAYINHDIDDAIRAGVLSEDDIPREIRRELGDGKSQRINKMVLSVINNSGEDICMDDCTAEYFEKLHEFMFQNVYLNPKCKSEEGKAQDVIQRLYSLFVLYPEKLPDEYRHILETEGAERAACDYIAGMSDGFALQTYIRLFVPKGWGE